MMWINRLISRVYPVAADLTLHSNNELASAATEYGMADAPQPFRHYLDAGIQSPKHDNLAAEPSLSRN
jgi:hypothetical protein